MINNLRLHSRDKTRLPRTEDNGSRSERWLQPWKSRLRSQGLLTRKENKSHMLGAKEHDDAMAEQVSGRRSGCRLLELPAELRQQIYDDLVPRGMIIRIDTRWPEGGMLDDGPPALAWTCRRMRSEILPLYFQSNTFAFMTTPSELEVYGSGRIVRTALRRLRERDRKSRDHDERCLGWVQNYLGEMSTIWIWPFDGVMGKRLNLANDLVNYEFRDSLYYGPCYWRNCMSCITAELCRKMLDDNVAVAHTRGETPVLSPTCLREIIRIIQIYGEHAGGGKREEEKWLKKNVPQRLRYSDPAHSHCAPGFWRWGPHLPYFTAMQYKSQTRQTLNLVEHRVNVAAGEHVTFESEEHSSCAELDGYVEGSLVYIDG